MPVSILEASASGLPVVSTRHSGIPEIVEHEKTGFLVEERDVVNMAHYMRPLALEPGLASTMGAAARSLALAHFSMDRSIHGLWEIIKNSTGK
jgi:glycosyltransferase involved in cell wall biosynthesis